LSQQKSIRAGFSLMFQFKYCCVIAVLFAAASVLLFLMMDKALPGTYRESLRVLYYLEQNLPFYLGVMALLLVLFILVLTLIITLLVSHQIAGPVYRYEFALKQMLKGEFPKKISTRQADQLKPMVDSLNRLTERYITIYGEGMDLSVATDVVLQNKAANAVEVKNLLAQINGLRAKLQGRNCQGSSK
jgi:nitrogen fixation/metabolism regulation signal transduction histidine kinase